MRVPEALRLILEETGHFTLNERKWKQREKRIEQILDSVWAEAYEEGTHEVFGKRDTAPS